MQFSGLTIGVPKEIMAGECRIAAIPETVRRMVGLGAAVIVESEAGTAAHYSDAQFTEAGAQVVAGAKEVYAAADIIMKVKEPLFNEALGIHETDLLKAGATIITFLHPANAKNHGTIRRLAERGVLSYTLDSIPRTSTAQRMDALTSMSTVAGYKGTIMAAYHLARFVPMMPTTFGMIKPAEFIVIGVGVSGLQAIATAKRLGAKVKSLDIRPEAAEQAKSLGAEVIPFDVPAELALGAGGYAKRLPEEWYAKERDVLRPHLKTADAVILTALIPGEVAPIMIDEEMIKDMKPGAVIIDIAIDQGGNCAATKYGQEYINNGVLISGIMNIPSTLAIDSTFMFAQNIFYFLSHVVQEGHVRRDTSDQIMASAMVTVDGKIVHHGTLASMGEA